MQNKPYRVTVYAVLILTLFSISATVSFFYTDSLMGYRPTITGMATSGVVNVSVIGFASLTINSNVEFGQGATGAEGNETVLTTETNQTGTFNDCGDDVNWTNSTYECRGIEIENDGNIYINVTMSASANPNEFWKGNNATDEFQYATLNGNRSRQETDSCVSDTTRNVTIYPLRSNTTYLNLTDISTTATLICGNLSFGSNDTVTIEFNLTIPSDEPVGVKTNTFTFTATQVT
ncbi:hypothetical protein HQ529_00180 [Candidatus Woesearchaeota archaeon]|nr:hypothetical protein [Candidatus Woesearchaeota archaeon]